MGMFDTVDLEKHWNVSVYPQQARKFGWGFSKLEFFFGENKKRFLVLDSDIVMAGPVLDELEKYNEDFIVHEEPFSMEDVYRWYFDLEKLQQFDPDFKFPNFTFNTGQIAGTVGLLSRKDFDPFLDWTEPRIMKHREVFTFGGEQPVLNYIIMKKIAEGKITVRRNFFMRESQHPDSSAVKIENLIQKKGYPFIIHWHDKKPDVFLPSMRKIPRADILRYFEKIYYEKSGYNGMQRLYRIWKDYIGDKVKVNLGKLYANNPAIAKLFRRRK